MNATVEDLCRVALALLLGGLAGVGIPHRRRADRVGGPVSRRGDPRWFWPLMALVGPPVAIAVAAFLVHPRWMDRAALPVPAAMRLLGIPLGMAGWAWFAAVFRHLGLNVTSTSTPRRDGTLVTSGPYRRVRHPMYTAALVLLAATVLLTANGIVLAGGLAAFLLLAARSREEERHLVRKFGADYEAYQRRTGRFFPRWSRGGREGG